MERLYELLDRYNATAPGDAAEAEAEIWRAYGTDETVLVLDMAGFSRVVRRYGIVQYLAMVRRMQIVTRPIVVQHGGVVVKYEADNLFAAFDQAPAAVACAVAIRRAFDTINPHTPNDRDIHVSIGLASGRILLVPDDDYFGDAVNIASKLGEDLAGNGEILLSETTFALLPPDAPHTLEKVSFSISGLDLVAYSVAPK